MQSRRRTQSEARDTRVSKRSENAHARLLSEQQQKMNGDDNISFEEGPKARGEDDNYFFDEREDEEVARGEKAARKAREDGAARGNETARKAREDGEATRKASEDEEAARKMKEDEEAIRKAREDGEAARKARDDLEAARRKAKAPRKEREMVAKDKDPPEQYVESSSDEEAVRDAEYYKRKLYGYLGTDGYLVSIGALVYLGLANRACRVVIGLTR